MHSSSNPAVELFYQKPRLPLNFDDSDSKALTMSSSLLARRIVSSSSLLRTHHPALLPPLLRALSLSTKTQQQKEAPFLAQYLISSLGFSPDRALKVSSDKRFARISSSSGPESVVHFLKEIGLSDAKIKSAISFHPKLLCLSVDKTLKPNVQQLMAAGFTGEILVELIRCSPPLLQMTSPIPIARLQFWRTLVGNSDAFLKLIRNNGLLLLCDIDKRVTPRINLLQEYGFSNQEIVKLLTAGRCRFLHFRFSNFSQKLKETEALGFSRHSKMFLYGLLRIGSYKKETIEKKSRFFQKMYGWSEEEVRHAFLRFPNILAISEEKVKATMDFLIKSAGLESRSIASQPMLFSFSLEKRLIPRHHVLGILKEHVKKNFKLLSACVYTEKAFLKKFIMPYEKDVPGLAEAYAAACSRKVSH